MSTNNKFLIFAAAILSMVLTQAVHSDGTLDGRIGLPYGSTRAIDSGNDVSGDGECTDSAGRGNLMDFFAMSLSGNATGTNDPWYFSWTVDSSQALDDTAGTFFGTPATIKANYIIGIEVACDGAPRLEMWENGQPWEREFAWNVDYFIAMFPNGPNSMEAQLWQNDGGNSRSLIAGGIAVTSRVVGFRRQVELVLPAADPVPEALRNNSTLCLYLLSVQDIDGTGTVLDGIGLLNHNVNCEAAAFDLSSLGSVFINTAANCKEGGAPTDAGTNDRQCLSNPRRDTIASVPGEDCSPPFGIAIDGSIDSKYVLNSENSFAAPYRGGSAAGSDFVGESSARAYTYAAGGSTNTVELTGGQHADIANFYTFADTNYLYLLVTGPTSLGWELEPDLFNLYIAIDRVSVTSSNDTGSVSDLAPGDATAPAGRLVNFKGWDPDYVVELFWRGATQGADMPANLFAATGPGTWSVSGSFLYQDVPDTAATAPGLYYSRTFPQYEFAIPWSSLGFTEAPGPSEVFRFGIYTTGDENIETAGVSAWDIADQAPGIGQGCGGEGCHERVGDDAFDDDDLASGGAGDRTPFVGRSYGNPSFVPATDNSNNDVDTIEEYFTLTIDLADCTPGIDIEKSTNGQDADSPTGPFIPPGSNVVWSYVVTNTGLSALTNVVVTDDQLGVISGPAAGDANTNGLLDIGEAWVYTTNGTATAGQYVNTGSVSAVSVLSVPVSADDASHYFSPITGIQIEKATNGEDADTPAGPLVAAGSNVVWTYTVINTGNEAITNVVVNDTDLGAITNLVSGDINANTLLDTNETWVFTASASAVAGQYSNDSTVAGTTVISATPVSDSDPSHYFGAAPGVSIEKSTNGEDADAPDGPSIGVGNAVTWTYVITNAGNVALTNVVVTDDQLGVIAGPDSGDTNTNGLLDIGEIWTYSTNGLAAAGPYVNTGVVDAVSIIGQPVTDDDPSHYFGGTGGISIEKATNGEDADTPSGPLVAVGSNVVWTYTVSNTGNEAITNVTVTDSDLGAITNLVSGDANANSLLDTNETWVFTATGIAVSGQYSNDSTAAGTTLSTGSPVSDNDPSHYYGAQPGIDIEKYTQGQDADTASGPLVAVGATVTWTYAVTNNGNVALTNVSVTDDRVGTIAGPDAGDSNTNGLLDVGETWLYTTNAPATAGQYVNTGAVNAVSLVGQPVADLDPSHYFGADPAISIEKFTNGEDADAPDGPSIGVGNAVAWTYVITNAGNVALTNVVVTDDQLGVITGPDSGDANTNGLLDISEVWTYSTNGLAAAGPYVNTGVVDAVSIIGQPVTDDDPSHYFGGTGGISIEKATNGEDADAPSGPIVAVGSNVVWTYTVSNTGNEAITNVSVTDSVLGVITNLVSGDANANSLLDTNETWVYSVAGSAVWGQYSNDSSAAGTTVSTGSPVSDNDPSHYFGSAPGFTIEKTRTEPVPGPAYPGDLVTFEIALVNTGNVELVFDRIVDTYDPSYLSFVTGKPETVTAAPGVLIWSNFFGSSLLPGEDYVVTALFTAVTATPGDRTNVAVAAFDVPPGNPPVDSKTNDAPYNIAAFASIGDFVWHDLNADGYQDVGETGLVGIVVTLYDAMTNAAGVVTTDVNGVYAFTNLLPGTYVVGFDLPPGASFSPQNAVNDAEDSDAAPVTGLSDPVTLAAGENNADVDAGIVFPATIGDFVWNDADADGIQDGSETGMPGVVVTLIDVASNTVGIVTTDVNGAYAFTNLAPGYYGVYFLQPSGTVFTAANVGGDDTVDSDPDPSPVPGNGWVFPGYLESGTVDDTIDAGLIPLASVGDFVWLDLVDNNGIQDFGEPGVPDLVLVLYETSGVAVASTTSTASGAYAFTDVPPGSYYIGVVISTAVDLVDPYQGGDTNEDSNADPVTGLTEIFVLAPGENNMSIDFGVQEFLVLASTVSAEGENREGEAVLVWTTSSEYGIDGWYIEKAMQGAEWERVSIRLPSSGIIDGGAVYSWTDRSVAPGETATYRIVETEVFGRSRIAGEYTIAYPVQPGPDAPPAHGFSLAPLSPAQAPGTFATP